MRWKVFRIFYLCLMPYANSSPHWYPLFIGNFLNSISPSWTIEYNFHFQLNQYPSPKISWIEQFFWFTTNRLQNLPYLALEKGAAKCWKLTKVPFSVSQISSNDKSGLCFRFEHRNCQISIPSSTRPPGPYISTRCANNAKWVSSQKNGNLTFQILIQTTIFPRRPT